MHILKAKYMSEFNCYSFYLRKKEKKAKSQPIMKSIKK